MSAETTRRQWLIFLLLAVAQFMVVLDVSITNIALPSIMQELGFAANDLQWVLTAYALSFGGFLLFGGRASDLFGRKRVLLIGISAFTIISLLIGFSVSPLMLIVLRALQGVAAALMTPAALSIVLVTFEEQSARNQALGFWSLVATGGAAAGLLLGGALTQYLSWRWDFFVNVPIGIVLTYLCYLMLPEHEHEAAHQELDLPGAISVTLGLVALVYAFSMAPVWGWTSIGTLAMGVLAIALLVFFVCNESRSTHPLMPLSIFAIRNVTGANAIMAPIVAGMFGMFYLASLYIQQVLHYTPVLTGLAFLPFPFIVGVVSSYVPRYVSRYGFKPFIIAGLMLTIAGMAWMTRMPVDATYVIDLLPTFVLMPLGLGMVFMPIVASATYGVPPDEAGLASGLITTSQQMGGALGLSILTSVAASVTAAAADPTSAEALVHGYRYAFGTGLLFLVGSLVLAIFVIRQVSQKETEAAPLAPLH
jgi:EmrB/QacA subfamily drug resistance transporter